MKTNILAVIFLFLFSGSVSGEDLDVQRKYWDNGKLKALAHFKNGKREGLMTSWYKNGRKGETYISKNGKRERKTTKWYPSGKKKSTSHYKNVIENGLKKEWDEYGKLTFQGNFVDGNEAVE